MSRQWRFPVVYAFAIPLALILGYLVSTPDMFSIGLVGMIVLFLALPLFLRWHHALVIVTWNAVLYFSFLPGRPDFWVAFVWLSLGISALNYFMFQKKFLRVPEVSRPLLLLGAVVVMTAFVRGGFGLHSLGGNAYGGRNYFLLLTAIAGYFALSAEQVPMARARRMAGFYFLSGVTEVLGNIAYSLGPAFFFLYYIVPATGTSFQVANEFGLTDIDRIVGLNGTCNAIFCFLLTQYGIRGIFDWSKPWRFLLFTATFVTSLFAGYRSGPVMLMLIFCVQFYFEGLMRTRLLPVLGTIAALTLSLVVLFSDRLPHAVQRAISYLPVKIDAEVRADARSSADWRFQMWDIVIKDVPRYLIVGKGYGIDPTEMFLTMEGARMGLLSNYEESMLAGDYHNGPLSVIIPLGLGGVVAFVWLLGAGWWVLWSNYRLGELRLRRVNTILLSYYTAYIFAFFFIFGALNSQLPCFVGVIGMSVCLNGGVKRKTSAPVKAAAVPELIAFDSSGVKA